MTVRQSVSFMMFAIGVCSAAAEAGQDLARSQRYYEAAMAAGDEERRIDLLERSYEERPTYEAAIELGEPCLGSTSGNGPTTGCGTRTTSWATFQSTVFGHCSASGRRTPARAVGRSRSRTLTADELHNEPMIREALQDAHRQAGGQMVPSQEIVSALEGGRGAEVEPRINLYINFEFDSARMTGDGLRQAEELGRAMRRLADRGLEDFVLVGHTDAQGARSYNQALSVRRAQAVRTYVVDEFGLDRRDIVAEGRGEDDLLDPEGTEAAHSVNRRVEVQVRRR